VPPTPGSDLIEDITSVRELRSSPLCRIGKLEIQQTRLVISPARALDSDHSVFKAERSAYKAEACKDAGKGPRTHGKLQSLGVRREELGEI